MTNQFQSVKSRTMKNEWGVAIEIVRMMELRGFENIQLTDNFEGRAKYIGDQITFTIGQENLYIGGISAKMHEEALDAYIDFLDKMRQL